MKISDREITREIKFPDRESREIGKDLCTRYVLKCFSLDSWNQVAILESLLKDEAGALSRMRNRREYSHVTLKATLFF